LREWEGAEVMGNPWLIKTDKMGLVIAIFFGLFIAFMAMYFFLVSIYSGSAQWILVLVLIALISGVTVLLVRRGMRKQMDVLPAALEVDRGKDASALGNLRGSMKRADDGLRYSQLIVKRKFVKTLLYKIRVENELSPEEMKAMGDSEAITRYVHDKDLRDFSINCIDKLNQWSDSIHEKPDLDFINNFDKMIDRMEV
jgi:hypothetical protein